MKKRRDEGEKEEEEEGENRGKGGKRKERTGNREGRSLERSFVNRERTS